MMYQVPYSQMNATKYMDKFSTLNGNLVDGGRKDSNFGSRCFEQVKPKFHNFLISLTKMPEKEATLQQN